MEDDKFEVKGGSLDKALRGEVKLDLKLHVKEAWELTKQQKAEMLHGALLLVVAAFALAFLIQAVFDIDNLETASAQNLLIIKLIGVAVTAPIIAAMSLLGIAHSVGQRPAFFNLFKRIVGLMVVVVLALLIAAFTDLFSALTSTVSGLLSLIFTVYIGMATGFSVLLLIEKKLALTQAIVQSFKVFNRYILPLSIFYLMFFALMIVGMFTFGIAYIWLIPFYFNLKGVLYRELFGVSVRKNDTPESAQQESVFHV